LINQIFNALPNGTKRNSMIFAITILFVLMQNGLVLAVGSDSTAVLADPTTASLTSLGGGVAIFVNFFRYIGGTILLGFGYYHTFSVSAHAKNATKRALAVEGLLWVGISVLLFFMAPYLMGVLKGVGGTISGTP